MCLEQIIYMLLWISVQSQRKGLFVFVTGNIFVVIIHSIVLLLFISTCGIINIRYMLTTYVILSRAREDGPWWRSQIPVVGVTLMPYLSVRIFKNRRKKISCSWVSISITSYDNFCLQHWALENIPSIKHSIGLSWGTVIKSRTLNNDILHMCTFFCIFLQLSHFLS